MDMVRLILAKAMDEEQASELPEFYCTPEEYATQEGRQAVAERVHTLFKGVIARTLTCLASTKKYPLVHVQFATLSSNFNPTEC